MMDKPQLWTTLLLLCGCLALPALFSSAAMSPAPVATATVAPGLPESDNTLTSASLSEAVQQWMQHLAGEPGYTAWKQATWSSYPLGPGTHGWIVLIQAGGKDIGYMVIHAADPQIPDKYQLTEYGSGGKPLFSLHTLYQALVQLELIHTSYTAERWYAAPMLAVWIIQADGNSYYIDAKTGEQLPTLDLSQPKNNSLGAASIVTSLYPEHILKQSLELPDFNPYGKLPWLQGNPAVFASFAELEAELQLKHRITLLLELYHGQVFIALPVIGFQRWSNDGIFLKLEQDGQRAIPYAAVARFGKLYR
ncbi:hypothetical protein [Paenibacillus agricola]|uniref:PepSY domain-containing protein n=1 Tax=Paenibacillus agricola TaxID=2716264 RepID=A0ABX0JBM5_9BACL|nr:hypothetical protein [Paenibacillus agricola]NHN31110.1 hypothetical protein [Paenibacillus agricola]